MKNPDDTVVRQARVPPVPVWFHIANMDCPSEEAEIRQALDGIEGIQRLQFWLGGRALGITADAGALPRALSAIRKGGFKPVPMGAATMPGAVSPGTGVGMSRPADRGSDGKDSVCGCIARHGENRAGASRAGRMIDDESQGDKVCRGAEERPDTCASTRSSGCCGGAGTSGGGRPHVPSGRVDDTRAWWALLSEFWQPWGRLLVALALALLAELIALSGGHGEGGYLGTGDRLVGMASFAPGDIPGMLIAAGAIALSGLSVYGKGMAALRQRRLNINALMTVAVTGAFLIGQWPEAAMVMALYGLAEAIDARAVDRARNAIASLMAQAPEEAEVRQGDGSWVHVPVVAVAVDSVVRVRPGGRVPLDGVVVQGHSAIDQSSITGESLPVGKHPGDEIFAGTINEAGALEIRVTALAGDSTLARIIHMVEQAQLARAPSQRLVDRFAAVYTPAVFGLAVAVMLLLPWLTDVTVLQAIYQALVLLVIACPCALVISTPVAVVSALTWAARRGILIKGGAHLEGARRLKAVALDKTGTLTEGRPQLMAFEEIDATMDAVLLRRLAASLAQGSDHPVSQAIVEGLMPGKQNRDLAATGGLLHVQDFQALPGRGVQGVISLRHTDSGSAVVRGVPTCSAGCAPVDDRQRAEASDLRVSGTHVLASYRWIEARGQCSPALAARLAVYEQAGCTVTLLADDQQVLALLAVADTIRPTTAVAVASLRAQGIIPVMLTGDNPATARSVAARIGIDEVHAGLLPEEKLQVIVCLRQQYGCVAMVGDGINDAPALVRANLGFAMGAAGTDIAIEAADVLIMNDDLRRLPEIIALSRRTHLVLWQNMALALGIKLIFVLLAIGGQATMWMAVFADMGASLLVVANGLRLLRNHPRLPF